MKVVFKYGIGAMAGTIAEGTFFMTRQKTGSIMRKWVQPKLTLQNTALGAKTKNLALVYGSLSSGYKDDLKSYCTRYNYTYLDPNDPFSPQLYDFAVFMKLMYAFADGDESHIDLATITYGDLSTLGEDIDTIALAVANGFLPYVPDAVDFTQTM
jgi:hypothetical protein